MTANSWETKSRLGGLRRFAIAISVLNLLGHFYFGFEQSWATPLVALSAAYGTELLLEWLGSWARGVPPAYRGTLQKKIDFFLPAHISALAVGMLLYCNDRLWPVAFAAAAAIASKSLFRIKVGSGFRHFFNPSNFGISITLLCFPWVGISPPYMFTENLDGAADWILPAVLVCSGSFLNFKFTHRLPLIGAWLGTFVLQAAARHFLLGASLAAALGPMTGVAFLLYTFYMVTDPATTPQPWREQVLFGAATALCYGALMISHLVFGLFFALTIVCGIRGVSIFAQQVFARNALEPQRLALAAAQSGD